jgi:hypothetical protein
MATAFLLRRKHWVCGLFADDVIAFNILRNIGAHSAR